jgi:hypothetical protein
VKEEDQNSPLNWLADVALSNEDKKPCEVIEIEKPCRVGEDKQGKHGYNTLYKHCPRVI